METMVKLAIESMNTQIEGLKATVKEQQMRITQLEKRSDHAPMVNPEPQLKHDELLSNQQVKRILGISRNSILKLVADGILKVIRINQRTVRYSRVSIMQYIEKNQSLA